MEYTLFGAFWLTCIYLGYLLGKKKDSLILFVCASAIWPGCGLLIVFLMSLGMPDARVVGAKSMQKFDSGKNPRFYEHSVDQLYYYWGNSYDGIAVDLPGRSVYLSTKGRGRWFGVSEIKNYSLSDSEMSFVTTDLDFPEFVWRLNSNASFDTGPLDRALKASGNFSRG